MKLDLEVKMPIHFETQKKCAQIARRSHLKIEISRNKVGVMEIVPN